MKQNALGEIKARALAWRYGHPARGLKVIAVAGAKGKTTTALLLNELLLESGAKVAVFTNKACRYDQEILHETYDTSPEALYGQLQSVKKKGAYYVIIEITDKLLESQVLPALPIDMSIVTSESESANALLEHPAGSAVIPSGFNIENVNVAPHQLISFGTDEAAEARIVGVTERRKGTEIELLVDHQTRIMVATYLIGQANALNVAAAVSAAYVLAISTEHFEEGVARLERVTGNYEYIELKNELYEVVVDGATMPESVNLVIDSAKKLSKRRLIVIADSSVSADVYVSAARTANRFIAVNSGPTLPGVEMTANLEEAIEIAKRAAKREDLILFIGEDVATVQPNGITYAEKLMGEKQTDEQ